MSKVPLVLGVLFLAVALLAIHVAGNARRIRGGKSGGGGHFGWALLFLASGRMPPPPPETQIEAEVNTEKDRGVSKPLQIPANTYLFGSGSSDGNISHPHSHHGSSHAGFDAGHSGGHGRGSH